MRARNPWLMTDERMGDAVLAAVRALPPGSGVVFRHRSLRRGARHALFRRVKRVAVARRLLLVSVGGLDFGPAHGGPRPFTAPAHDRRQALRAVRAGARYLFVSPVFATRSHADAQGIGAMRAARIGRGLGARTIALGGMDGRRWQRLRHLGVDGWAAIDALTPQKRKAVPK